MTAQVPPADFDKIAARNNMSREDLDTFMAVVQEGMLPMARRIPVIENGERRYYLVESRGVGPIVTAYGTFWMFDFSIDDQWEKYTVIVRSDLDNTKFRPVFQDPTKLILRTDSGCETGQMFGAWACLSNWQHSGSRMHSVLTLSSQLQCWHQMA